MRSVKIHSSSTSKSLIICLTSYGNDQQPAPGFEWINIASEISAHKILMRDLSQHWYLGSILDFSINYDDTIARLKHYITTNSIERIAVVGSSMGGFAAINIGAALKADLVLAFAPQTCLNPEFLTTINDRRWQWKTREMEGIGYDRRDLTEILSVDRPKETHVYFDPTLDMDKQHACRISDYGGVILHEVEGGHLVAKVIAKAGVITQKLTAFVSTK